MLHMVNISIFEENTMYQILKRFFEGQLLSVAYKFSRMKTPLLASVDVPSGAAMFLWSSGTTAPILILLLIPWTWIYVVSEHMTQGTSWVFEIRISRKL